MMRKFGLKDQCIIKYLLSCSYFQMALLHYSLMMFRVSLLRLLPGDQHVSLNWLYIYNFNQLPMFPLNESLRPPPRPTPGPPQTGALVCKIRWGFLTVQLTLLRRGRVLHKDEAIFSKRVRSRSRTSRRDFASGASN